MGKVYRIAVNVRLSEIQEVLIPIAPGQVQRMEKVLMVQVTEAAGEGESPKVALEQAMANGLGQYLEGVSEAEDVSRILPPTKGDTEWH